MTDKGYRIECADPVREQTRVLEFWKSVGFGLPNSKERYSWFYIRNPVEQSRLYLLISEEGGSLIGTVGAGTRLLRLPSGEIRRAALLVDFVVHPAHRSVGPALALQRSAREQELARVEIVYGLPDAKAVPVFKRLGANQRFSTGMFAHVIQSGAYLSRHLPRWAAPLGRAIAAVVDPVRAFRLRVDSALSGYRVTLDATAAEFMEDIWVSSAGPAECGIGVRNVEFLQWRFPRTEGWRFAVIRGVRQDRAVAYVAYRRNEDEFHIGDMLLPADPAAAVRVLRVFLALCHRERVRIVRVDLTEGSYSRAVMRGAGFALRGQRPCFLSWRPTVPQGALPSEWWFTKADEDV